jgi:hypothetical protein
MRKVPPEHNASTIWRRPNPIGHPRRKTHVVQRIVAMRSKDRQWTRCLNAEGKRAIVKRRRRIWRGVRPNAEVRCGGGYDRGLAIDCDDGVERPSRWRGALRRRDSGPVVVTAARGRDRCDVRPGRGGVMTSRRARDGVAMRLARLSTSVEHNRQRHDSQSQPGCYRNLCGAEHVSILPYGSHTLAQSLRSASCSCRQQRSSIRRCRLE